jgi:hypothetical protein
VRSGGNAKRRNQASFKQGSTTMIRKIYRVNVKVEAIDQRDGRKCYYPLHIGFAADNQSACSFAGALNAERLVAEFQLPHRDREWYVKTGNFDFDIAAV